MSPYKKSSEPREIEYVRDATGKEIKFAAAPAKGFEPSKHQASKRGHKHFETYKGEKSRSKALSNHERIIARRAKKLQISVERYRELFSKRS